MPASDPAVDPPGPGLRVGPLLRWVGEDCATVWVETAAPAEVEVLGSRARTWSVHGHHYALVVVEGLTPASTTPYEVRVDGQLVWPPADSRFPPSVIRTGLQSEPVRMAFGSCRALASYDQTGFASHGADALVALAERVAAGAIPLPDALLLLGDQVYADEPDDRMRERLRRRPGVDPDVAEEICNFEEYTWLYDCSWSEPAIQWLLSTVSTSMILDDHDLRDDWNSSWQWRQEMTAKPWWRGRVVGAFGSYWVYQHIGNLSPERLAADPTWQGLHAAPDESARNAVLDEMAWQSDAEPSSQRWSYVRQLGGVRLVVVDSRCSRSLSPGHRGVLDAAAWQWFCEQLTGEFDHLVIGTSLPWLLTPSVHELEGWNEATAGGAWGGVFARLAEKVRLAVDLEHWAAFRASFDAITQVLADAATGRRGPAPASILVLSGDVHLSYAARARFAGFEAAAPVWQLVMSPFRNPLSATIRRVDTVLGLPPTRRAITWLARRAGVPPPPLQWDVDHGPWYENGISTLVLDGREARLHTDLAELGTGGRQVLRRVLDETLTSGT